MANQTLQSMNRHPFPHTVLSPFFGIPVAGSRMSSTDVQKARQNNLDLAKNVSPRPIYDSYKLDYHLLWVDGACFLCVALGRWVSFSTCKMAILILEVESFPVLLLHLDFTSLKHRNPWTNCKWDAVPRGLASGRFASASFHCTGNCCVIYDDHKVWFSKMSKCRRRMEDGEATLGENQVYVHRVSVKMNIFRFNGLR